MLSLLVDDTDETYPLARVVLLGVDMNLGELEDVVVPDDSEEASRPLFLCLGVVGPFLPFVLALLFSQVFHWPTRPLPLLLTFLAGESIVPGSRGCVDGPSAKSPLSSVMVD